MTKPPPPSELRRPLFSARTTAVVRFAILGLLLTASAGGYSIYEYFHSPYWNRVGLAPDQPVLFSHRHHVGELGIDCRFCHSRVETDAVAGLPSTQTCLNCHSQLFADSPLLAPVRASARDAVPLAWGRVNTLPDHVHFNHSIHIAKGIACVSCHGEVGGMALTAKGRALTMRECLDCHRDPAPHQVQPDRVFVATAPDALDNAGKIEDRPLPPLHPKPLTNCSTCHH